MSLPLFTDPRRAREGWLGWAEQSGLPLDGEDRHLCETFLPELAAYCELVSGPSRMPIGLMTRAEDESFTTRVDTLMRDWDIPAEAIARYHQQAEFFEHKRAFLKLEWARGIDGDLDRLIAYYYRRRPAVDVIRRRYAASGVARAPLERVRMLASLLGKRSIHFVAAALRPNRPVHHKLYFSQYATPESAAPLAHRLAEAMRLFGIDPGVAAEQLEHHRRLVPRSRTCTLFVSMKFTDRELLPGLKIDYPNVSLDQLGMLSRAEERPALIETARSLCTAAGARTVTFVGVTLFSQGPARLKLYADLPPPVVPQISGG